MAYKKHLLKKMKARWQIYLLLLLPVLYLVIFCYVPMFGQIIAFKDYNISDGIWGSKWVGLANFRTFFESYQFEQVLRNTLVLSIYGFLAGFPIPIALALILNALPGRRFKKLVQGTAFIPYFISTVVMVGLVLKILNNRSGLYGAVLMALTGRTPMDLFSKGSLFKHIYVWSGVWQSMGYNTVVYTAALAGVDESLHDAARIDRANRFQRLLHVDWPAIKPTVVIMMILSLGHIMSVGLDKALLMQNNINLNHSEIISTYVYKIGLASGLGNFSLSTAISIFNAVINLIMLFLANTISKKVTENSIF